MKMFSRNCWNRNVLLPVMTVAMTALLCHQVAEAQEDGGRRREGNRQRPGIGRTGGGFSGAMLLRNEKIQQELKLTDAQKEKITAASTESREKMRELFSGLRDKSREERREAFEKMREESETLRKKSEEQILSALTENQKERLQGIQLQMQGVRALSDPEVAKKLDIDELQQEEIKLALEEARSKSQSQMRELFAGVRDGSVKREEMQKKMEELRAESEKAALEVLTAEQRKKLDSMKGEKIELSPRDLFGGRGGFGQGRRPGGDGEGRRGDGEGRRGRRGDRDNDNRSNDN